MTTTKIAIGIDIGGTNTVWGMVNEQGQVLKKGKWSTKSYPQVENFVQQAATTINELLQDRKSVV